MPRMKPNPLPIILEKDIRFLGRFVSRTLDDATLNKLRAYNTSKKPIKTRVRLTSSGITIGEKPAGISSVLSRPKTTYEFIPNYDVHTLSIDNLQRDVALCIVHLGSVQFEIYAIRFNTDAEANIFVHAFEEVTNRKRDLQKLDKPTVSTKEADTNTTDSIESFSQRQQPHLSLASGSKDSRNWSLTRREQKHRSSSQTPSIYTWKTTGGDEREEFASASRSLQNVLEAISPPSNQQSKSQRKDGNENIYQVVEKKRIITTKKEPLKDETNQMAVNNSRQGRKRESAESLAKAFEQQRKAVSKSVNGRYLQDSINAIPNESDAAFDANGAEEQQKRPQKRANKSYHNNTNDSDESEYSGSLQRSDRQSGRYSTLSQMSDSVRDEICSIHQEVKDIKDMLGMLHKQFAEVRRLEKATQNNVIVPMKGTILAEQQKNEIFNDHKIGMQNERNVSKNNATASVVIERHVPQKIIAPKQSARPVNEEATGFARATVSDYREQPLPIQVQSHQRPGYGTLPPLRRSNAMQRERPTTFNSLNARTANQFFVSSIQAPPQQTPPLPLQMTPNTATIAPQNDQYAAYNQQYVYPGYVHQMPVHPSHTATIRSLPGNVNNYISYNNQNEVIMYDMNDQQPAKMGIPIEIIETVPIKPARGRSLSKNSKKGSKSRSNSRDWSRSASRDSSKKSVGFSRFDETRRIPEVVSEIARHGVKNGQPVHVYEVVRL